MREDNLIKLNREVVRYIGNLDATLRQINDTNVLHAKILDENTKANKEIAESFKSTVNSFNNVANVVKLLLLLLIGALIILAGAERVFQYVKL